MKPSAIKTALGFFTSVDAQNYKAKVITSYLMTGADR
jgi:hypothetical protein